jgi:hypothetical protein
LTRTDKAINTWTIVKPARQTAGFIAPFRNFPFNSHSRGEFLRAGFCRGFSGTSPHHWRFRRMPYFYFDLVIGKEFRDQGGMILEDLAAAADRADQLASELCIVRPELKSSGYEIRVLDDNGNEVYRTPLDALPIASAEHRKT